MEKIIKRQVKDVVIKTVVVEHRGEVKVCACGARTCGPFSEGVKAPMQAGDNIKTIALYLSGQFIAKQRLSEAMECIFGIPLSDTTLFVRRRSKMCTTTIKIVHGMGQFYTGVSG